MGTAERRPKLQVIGCWSILITVSLGTAISLALLASRMAPVRPGNSHTFWLSACNVSLEGKNDTLWAGDAYIIDESTAAYDWGGMHGTDLYQIPFAEVAQDFDAVLELLEAEQKRGKDTAYVQGYADWRGDEKSPRTPQSLLKSIQRAERNTWKQRDAESVAQSIKAEELFWERWQRANWYWANFVFEWLLLSGLVLIAVWPGVRNLRTWRWGLHIAVLPLFFMLPVYLGYSTYSFTSAGPSGGVLYPHLLRCVRGGSLTEFDTWLLSRLPQILEPMSTPIGTPMVLSGTGMPGPTSAVVAGIIAGGLVVVVRRASIQKQIKSHIQKHEDSTT